MKDTGYVWIERDIAVNVDGFNQACGWFVSSFVLLSPPKYFRIQIMQPGKASRCYTHLSISLVSLCKFPGTR